MATKPFTVDGNIVVDEATLSNSTSSLVLPAGSIITGGGTVLDATNSDTDDLSEGTANLYFTDARARSAISATGDISYDSATGVISFTATSAPVTSVNTQTGAVVLDTDNIAEGTNLYYTDARADARITLQVGANLDLSSKTTTDLAEGTNLYYTDARADARITLQVGANLDLSSKTTTDLAEGTNLYYTDARADARIALANIDAKVASYLSSNDFDTATNIVASITDSAPSTLDTLNELAAALGDDPNFATTVSTQIGTKLPLTGGTMTGDLYMGDSKRAVFGTGSDLLIYHDGSSSVIKDDQGGQLFLQSTGFNLSNSAGLKHIYANDSYGVSLYYQDSEKLGTSNTGVSVTGDITVTGTVDGRDVAQNIPSSLGSAGQVLQVNSGGTATEWATSAPDPTKGTLTKSFASGETASITLSSAVSPAPIVSATKEIPQSGISSKGAWDVETTGANYDRMDTAYSTTLTPSATGWNVPLASFNQSLNMTTSPFLSAATGQEAYPSGLYFKPDGLKMYVTGFDNDRINEFNLSTAFDISSASHVQGLSIGGSGSGQDDIPEDVFFKPDGTKMYFVGNDGNEVNEYNLSTAWDLSTASFNQRESVGTQEANPGGIFFKPDGLKMYIVGRSSDKVHEYNLSTAWDISTKSFLQSLSFAMEEGDASSVFFKPDGLKMYITGQEYDSVYTYTLTTAWDISTVYQYSSGSDNAWTTFSVTSKESTPKFLFFSPDGLKMYVGGTGSASIHEYNLPVSNNIVTLGTGSFASGDIGKTIEGNGGVAVLTAADGSYVATTAFTDSSTIASGSWSMHAVNVNTTNGLEMSQVGQNQFDISQASFIDSFSVQNKEYNPKGVFFKPDGLKVYITGASDSFLSQSVQEYDLATAWDITTASHTTRFGVNTIETSPTDIFFKDDGTVMYILGDSNEVISLFNLSTAWDISTAVYDQDFSVAGEASDPQGIFIGQDGGKLYILDDSSNSVYQYNLWPAWDFSTANYSVGFSVGSQESNPRGVSFKDDGTKMYVVGSSGNDVNEYDLSTAWDVSTASYLQNFSVASQDGTPEGLFLKSDGSKMFIIGRDQDEIFEYSIGTAASPTGHFPSITNSNGQIDSQYWTDINSMATDHSDGAGAVHYAVSTDNHATWSVIKEGTGVRPIVRDNGGTWQYNEASSGYGLSNAIYDNASVDVTSQTNLPTGMALSSDGTKMYIISSNGYKCWQYSLSTAWDVSTATYASKSFNFPEVVTARSITFKPDGTKMYIVESYSSVDSVFAYNLSTAWDVSTATYGSENESVATQDSEPLAVEFNSDGTKMYVLGANNASVFQYSLSTAYNVSTSTYDSVSFSLSSQTTSPSGLRFNADGTKMYVGSFNPDEIYQYSLSTAYDLSTASYDNVSFDFSAQEGTLYGFDWGDNGTKLYLVGVSTDTVYQYSTASYTTSTTWANSTTNSELYALQQALTDVSINRMDKTQLEAVTDPNHYTLGNSLDLMISLNLDSASASSPSSDGVNINYDAESLIQGAVLGTDYDYDFPNSTTVRVTSNAAQNLKVRVV